MAMGIIQMISPKGRKRLEDLGKDRKIILQCTLHFP
jgi:hypothetical protein